MATIIDKVENERGCGFRKKGGMYLISSGAALACQKLPIALTVCPCCGEGVKQSRGFKWVKYDLVKDPQCPKITEGKACLSCPFDGSVEKFGLMWVGEKFYPTPSKFTNEAALMGISKRIAQIPKELIVGETWVLLAHPKAVLFSQTTTTQYPAAPGEPEYLPGIFSAFVPQRIEYIVKGTETEEELDRMEKRGITLVNVIPAKQTEAALE